MDFSILSAYRRDAYAAITRAADALMDIADALLTDTRARSLAELTLSPFFRRQWCSIFAALKDGRFDRDRLLKVFARCVPWPGKGKRLVLAGDASSILRTDSPTAEDRAYVHASNLPAGTKPVRPGWQYSQLAALPDERSSWVYVLDNCRITTDQTQGDVMSEQLRDACKRLNQPFLFLGDGYYGSEAFRKATSGIACDVLVRFAKNRVLYRAPVATTRKRRPGRPPLHGAPFNLKKPSTYGEPDESFESTDEAGKRIEVRCWRKLHFQGAATDLVTVIMVVRHGAKDTKRDPKTSWLLFWGTDMPALSEIPAFYGRRYNLEHAFRVAKQNLLWDKPRLRTPEQFSLWTDVVSLVRNELFLARDQVAAVRMPWERSCRARTPEQVRRAMGRIIAELGTPAGVCQPRGKSGGWPKGRTRKRAATFPVVFRGGGKPKPGANPHFRKPPAPAIAG